MPPLASSILFHAIGAMSAAFCYIPQKKVKGWSWQSYWLIQAAFCWLILPMAGAFLTVPDFLEVVRQAPGDAMLRSFALGAAYGEKFSSLQDLEDKFRIFAAKTITQPLPP